MFPKRNFLNVFYPGEFFLLKKTASGICNFHKTALQQSKVLNSVYPVHVSTPYGKFFSNLTSSEMRKKKKTLLKQVQLEKDARNVQKNILRDFISSRTSATDEEWDTLVRKVTNSSGQLNEFNINGKIMEYAANDKNLSLMKDFLRYLKKKGVKFNQAVVIEFLRTCYECQNTLTEDDLRTVLFFTNYLFSNFKVMDIRLGCATIQGLSILNDWQKSLEVVENLEKQFPVTSSSVYTPLIVCLLKNKQFDAARKIMHNNLTREIKLRYEVYFEWIKVFQHDPDRLEELLNILKEYNVIPRKSVCDFLIQVYSKFSPEHRLRGKFTTVEFNGQCNSCRKILEKNTLRKGEFKEVRDAFLNRVVVSDDMFNNTTPEELQSFYKVVQTHGPFDIVIDGLNVIYTLGDGKRKATALEKVVNVCFARNKKIFIIGKKHMSNLPRRTMENIMEKSNMFLIDNESKDDPFMIYAALYSGPKCYIVTHDYLRSEKFRLGDYRLAKLFKQWQLSHQLLPQSLFHGNFETPLQFKLCIQRTTPQSWHIPYHDDDYTKSDLYERSDLVKWLCLRR